MSAIVTDAMRRMLERGAQDAGAVNVPAGGKTRDYQRMLVVHAPPLYSQEKIHPKVLIDDLLRETRVRQVRG